MLIIISGGQTGSDRAALDIAIAYSIEYEGWCPKGQLAEDGQISKDLYKYLKETDSSEYCERTEKNIINSDATLIFAPTIPIIIMDGTKLTEQLVHKHKKPHLIIEMDKKMNFNLISEKISTFIDKNKIIKLNVAGPRESTYPKAYIEPVPLHANN